MLYVVVYDRIKGHLLLYIYIYLLNTAISLKKIPYDCNTTAAAALSRVEPLVVSRTFLTTEPCNLVVLVVF